MTILGPLPCHRCYRPVRVERIGSYVRIMDGAQHPLVHHCPGDQPRPKPPEPIVCGAWMRNVREFCARAPGHSPAGGHRRRLIMDEESARRHGKRAAGWVQ